MRVRLGILAICVLQNAFGFMRAYQNVAIDSFPDGLKSNAANHPIHEGFVDITKPPYNAKGDGATDATAAIQSAINDAFVSNLAVYFPVGTYLVSGQLYCDQRKMAAAAGEANRKFCHKLIGSTKGPGRPKIKLRDNASFPQSDAILFERAEAPGAPSHYGSTFRGIDIDMGSNPSKNALSMAGAQYCVIEDVTITGNFNAGISSLPGSGGSTSNIRIVGGKMGILQDQFRPNPSVQGMVLENQSEYGIKLLDCRGPLVIAGFRIVSPSSPSATYRAVYAYSTSNWGADPTSAAVNLVDGSIEVSGAGGVAVEVYDQQTHLDNVYVKAPTVLKVGKSATPFVIAGSVGTWKKVARYAFAPGSENSHLIVQGSEKTATGADAQWCDTLVDVSQPADLVPEHIWDEATFPAWDKGDLVDIVRDFGATADNSSDDDAPKIQAAIDAVTTSGNQHYGKTVFIPRGHFHIKSGITVKNGLKMIGCENTNSVIHLSETWAPSQYIYALDCETSATGSAVLAYFAILGQQPTAEMNCLAHKNIGLMRVRLGSTMIRDIQFSRVEYWAGRSPYEYEVPALTLGEGSGGKLYNYSNDLTNSYTSDPSDISASFHKLYVTNNAKPWQIYNPSIEHQRDARGAQVLFENAKDVDIVGFKWETEQTLLELRGCDDIRVLGGSGLGDLMADQKLKEALILISSSDDILLMTLSRQTMVGVAGQWIVDDGFRVSKDDPVAYYLRGDPPATPDIGVVWRLPLASAPSLENVVRFNLLGQILPGSRRFPLASSIQIRRINSVKSRRFLGIR